MITNQGKVPMTEAKRMASRVWPTGWSAVFRSQTKSQYRTNKLMQGRASAMSVSTSRCKSDIRGGKSSLEIAPLTAVTMPAVSKDTLFFECIQTVAVSSTPRIPMKRSVLTLLSMQPCRNLESGQLERDVDAYSLKRFRQLNRSLA